MTSAIRKQHRTAMVQSGGLRLVRERTRATTDKDGNQIEVPVLAVQDQPGILGPAPTVGHGRHPPAPASPQADPNVAVRAQGIPRVSPHLTACGSVATAFRRVAPEVSLILTGERGLHARSRAVTTWHSACYIYES